MQLIAEYRDETDGFELTGEGIRIELDLEQMETLRETVALSLSERFQHKGELL